MGKSRMTIGMRILRKQTLRLGVNEHGGLAPKRGPTWYHRTRHRSRWRRSSLLQRRKPSMRTRTRSACRVFRRASMTCSASTLLSWAWLTESGCMRFWTALMPSYGMLRTLSDYRKNAMYFPCDLPSCQVSSSLRSSKPLCWLPYDHWCRRTGTLSTRKLGTGFGATWRRFWAKSLAKQLRGSAGYPGTWDLWKMRQRSCSAAKSMQSSSQWLQRGSTTSSNPPRGYSSSLTESLR
mmetsp:Transcript_61966/g.145290  ORF Transcript_61966/g.145290 Transcript_61966/m.145290 type:complete len:236 (+) Transcript_61966:969-1676(+)